KREAVAARIREDYGIELSELVRRDPESSEGSESGEEAPHGPAEIEELRKKLARLGSVNMEALDELTRVETECKHRKAQHDDLAQQAQPVLRARRSRCGARRGEHEPSRRCAARVPGSESVHRRDAQEADDGVRRSSLGRDHAREWHQPAVADAVRGLARRGRKA